MSTPNLGGNIAQVLLVDANGDPITAANPIPASASGLGYKAQVDTTRVNDTNIYTAKDVIGYSVAAGGAVWEFPNMGAIGAETIINKASLRIDHATAIASAFRVHLYNATPVSALGDNAAWDLAVADRVAYQGYIDFGTPIDEGATQYIQAVGNLLQVTMGATTSLFGYVIPITGYTPVASVVYSAGLSGFGV